MEDKEIAKLLETLISKIDNLTTTIKGKEETTKKEVKALSNENLNLDKIGEKIDDLSKAIREKKIDYENNIKQNPLAYLTGSFVGGIIVGALMRTKLKE